jgi:hypothetical protein
VTIVTAMTIVTSQRRVQKGAGNKRQGQRPFEPERQDCVGQPERQNLSIGAVSEQEACDLGSREQRTAIWSDLLDAMDCRAQSIIYFQIEKAGDMLDRVSIKGHASIGGRRQQAGCYTAKSAPGGQDATTGAWIILAMAKVEGVTQHRLVLATAEDSCACSGSPKRETLTPHPGKGRPGTYPSVEHGERGASPERSLT